LLRRSANDLDRIAAWTRVFGMVNSAPGFNAQPSVINGFSDLILEVFGAEVGAHARSAVGMAELPFGIPVEIEGEVELHV
jgi:enamine deaminase RidA (YjgF/YER057c/UK114 family)